MSSLILFYYPISITPSTLQTIAGQNVFSESRFFPTKPAKKIHAFKNFEWYRFFPIKFAAPFFYD
jgi:hypothetical protein